MTTSSKEDNSQNKNRRLAVGVEEFASGKKGVKRAIQEYKVRKERKVKEKAILLRKYKKVKKQQGYSDGGIPAERSGEYEVGKEEQHDHQHNNKRRMKPDPYQKSLQKAQQHKLEREQDQKQHRERQEQNKAKLKKRKERSKLLSKRTSKGQPVMKHVIHNILDKLQQQEE